MTRFGSVFLIAVASLGCASAQTAPSGPVDLKVLEAKIDAVVKPLVGKKSPSVAVVVMQGGKSLYRKAHGHADLAGKTPATTATLYKIGSLTKAFTAVVVQKLAAEGKLKLNDPIRPYFPGAPAEWEKITVRQLLNQVSGLPGYTTPFLASILAGKGTTPEEIVAWATKAKPNFSPGAKFEYSNTNYYLLGLIAEKAGGAPIDRLIQTRIFQPLGMKSAKLPMSGKTTPGESQGAAVLSGKLVAARQVDMSWPHAAGGIVASADDLALWISGIADGKILTEAQRSEAFTPAKLADGELSFYGYGWVLGTRETAPYISHGGEIDGFSSYVGYLPASDVRLVILTNSHAAEPWTLAKPILDAVEGKEPLPSIEDKDPKLTSRLRVVVDKMLKGERDEAEFAPGFLKAVPAETYAKTGKGLAELGPVQEFALTKDDKSGTGRVREYRLTLGDATLTAIFNLGADGKIAGFRLR